MQDLFAFFSFFSLFKSVSNFKTKSILEEKSVVREEWRSGHCFPLPLFVPTAYGRSLLGWSTYMAFWHLISSESQQCNHRKRGQGWLSGLLGKAGVYADHPGPLPNMALSFGLPTVHESA